MSASTFEKSFYSIKCFSIDYILLVLILTATRNIDKTYCWFKLNNVVTSLEVFNI